MYRTDDLRFYVTYAPRFLFFALKALAYTIARKELR
jgi:hypothetical protein